MTPPILIVPGLGGSGPEHWQSRWQARHNDARRVEQADWNKPDRANWIARVDAAVADSKRPPILVVHSLSSRAGLRSTRGRFMALCWLGRPMSNPTSARRRKRTSFGRCR